MVVHQVNIHRFIILERKVIRQLRDMHALQYPRPLPFKWVHPMVRLLAQIFFISHGTQHRQYEAHALCSCLRASFRSPSLNNRAPVNFTLPLWHAIWKEACT